MWSLIFKCTVYHFLELGHNASVAFVWPNVILFLSFLSKSKYCFWLQEEEEAYTSSLKEQFTQKSSTHLHVVPIPYDSVSSVEQNWDVLKNVYTVLWTGWNLSCIHFGHPFNSIVWKSTAWMCCYINLFLFRGQRKFLKTRLNLFWWTIPLRDRWGTEVVF